MNRLLPLFVLRDPCSSEGDSLTNAYNLSSPSIESDNPPVLVARFDSRAPRSQEFLQELCAAVGAELHGEIESTPPISVALPYRTRDGRQMAWQLCRTTAYSYRPGDPHPPVIPSSGPIARIDVVSFGRESALRIGLRQSPFAARLCTDLRSHTG